MNCSKVSGFSNSRIMVKVQESENLNTRYKGSVGYHSFASFHKSDIGARKSSSQPEVHVSISILTSEPVCTKAQVPFGDKEACGTSTYDYQRG